MDLSFNMQIDLKVGTCIHKTFVNGFNLWVDNRSILRQKIVEHNVLSCEHTLKGVPYITGRLLFKISWTFCFIWFLYADFKHLRDQNHREKSCYVVDELYLLINFSFTTFSTIIPLDYGIVQTIYGIFVFYFILSKKDVYLTT